MSLVIVYRTAWCPYCQRAEALLRARGVENAEIIDLDEHPQRRREMIERAGRTSVPQIFIDGEHVGGCDDLHALDREGRLAQMLAKSE
ncbi:MAG: glutaredoxin 3 [Burkholderiaceae bacterium]